MSTVAFGMAVIFVIYLFMDREELIQVIRIVDPKFLVIAFFLHIIAVTATMYRWKFVLDDAHIDISNWKLLQITFAGISVANLTPSARTGGEAIKSYFINKETGCRAKDSLATIIAERIFDLGFFILMGVLGIFISLFWFELPLWIIILMIFLVVFTAIMVLLVYYTVTSETFGLKIVLWLVNKFKRIIERFKSLGEIEEKLEKDFKEHSENLRVYIKKPKLWIKSMSSSGAMWTADIARIYFVFLAINLEVNPALLVSLIFVSRAAGMVPFLPGGLGAIEGTRMIMIASVGIATEGAGVHTVIDRFFQFWVVTIIGLIFAYYLGIKNYEEDEEKEKNRNKDKNQDELKIQRQNKKE
ncbi:MAG: lysylphosphatidylglycerol synthase transmembrane domain-containing protein [archaeon]